MNYQCIQCSCPFEHLKPRKFCSMPCFRIWSRGRINRGPKSLETKVKLSESQRGRKISIARKGMKFSVEHRKALSVAKTRFLLAGGFHGRQMRYESTKTGESNWAHSGFEIELMKLLDANHDVITWTKNHGISIPYEFNGQRSYIPDFKVEVHDDLVIIMEAKGYEFEPARCVAKTLAAEAFCEQKSWIYQVIRQRPVRVGD